MLAVSAFRSSVAESFPVKEDDKSVEDMLEGFDFDDMFIGIEDGDILPDLEMDPEMLAEFSVSSDDVSVERSEKEKKEEEKGSGSSEGSVTKRGGSAAGVSDSRKSKNSQGKRKVKVDWTPELHRRFVQAVEQLGVDKAVPSRILEIMGIDCLTRHNIASHLQKYRSHRKHLLAREAEAGSWSQRRQMYGGGKREGNPWLAAVPSIGFPPPSPIQHFRPLHVWGHPTVDQSVVHVWPKHLFPSPSPAWAPPPSSDPSFWHHHHLHQRFCAPPVAGFPFSALYKQDNSISHPQPDSQLQFDFHPSKESIDAALGDVLAKPWLPLPLGLKPPSLESVLVELQSQGISKLPPAAA